MGGNLSYFYWEDSNRYYQSATYIFMPQRNFLLWDAPLYPFILSILFTTLGQNELAPIILNIVLFSISTIILFLISRRLFNDKIAFYSTLIYSFHPSALSISILPLADPLFLCLLLLAIFFMTKFLIGGKYNNIIIAGALSGLTTLAKETGVLLVFIMALLILLKLRKTSARSLKAAFLLILGYALIISPVIIYNHKTTGQYSLSQKTNWYIGFLRTRIYKNIIRNKTRNLKAVDKKSPNFSSIKKYFRKRRSFFWGTGTIPLLRLAGYNIQYYTTTPTSALKFLEFLATIGWEWIVFQLIGWLFIGFIYISSFLSLCYLFVRKKYFQILFFALFISYFMTAYTYHYNSRYFFPIIAFLAPLAALCTDKASISHQS